MQKQQNWIFIGCPRMKQIVMNPIDQNVFLNTHGFFDFFFSMAILLLNNIFARFFAAITPEHIALFMPLFLEGRHLLGQEFGKGSSFF